MNSNPKPGPTPTSALDDAAKNGHFTWDGTFYEKYDDFFITRIDKDQQTATQFWGLLVNFNYTKVGGCQVRLHHHDEVLFAFDAFNKKFFLKLTGPLTVRRGLERTFTITDGPTGVPISGANIGEYTSDSNGIVKINFTTNGIHKLKAEHNDSIRSNSIFVRVRL